MPKNKKNSNEVPKFLINGVNLLYKINKSLTEKVIRYLFIKPIQYKTPKKELKMLHESTKSKLFVSKLNLNLQIYQWGNSSKKILLVHGWSGRGTQLAKIAEKCVENGYSVYSFDAPAHGSSEGKTAIMLDFIESLLEINKTYGPFYGIIGHSLGAMSSLHSVARGLDTEKIIILGSANKIDEIVKNYVLKLKLPLEIGEKMKAKFEQKYGEKMNTLSAEKACSKINEKTLIIHDKNDLDVSYKCSLQIHNLLINSQLLITENLGHRKILNDDKVVDKIMNFLNFE